MRVVKRIVNDPADGYLAGTALLVARDLVRVRRSCLPSLALIFHLFFFSVVVAVQEKLLSPEKLLLATSQMIQKLLSSSADASSSVPQDPTTSPRKRSRGDKADIRASVPYAALCAVRLVGQMVERLGEALTEYVRSN